MNKLKRVLIINFFGIGDVLFTTPVISNLKKTFPDVRIDYLCNRRTRSVLESDPNIHKVFVYERNDFLKTYKKSKIAFLKEARTFYQNIKNENYDAVIDLSMNKYMCFFTWLAGVKERVGFDFKNRGFFFNRKVKLKGYDDKHVVEYYLDLLKYLGVSTDIKNMQITVPQEDKKWAQDFLQSAHWDCSKPLIGLVPGGGASWGKDALYKRWPAERYAKLADKIIEKNNAQFILLGSEQEKDLCEEVGALMSKKPISACGKTSIQQFAAIAQECSFLILNDGGPLHISVAAGAQTVSIFGPVNNQVYGPYPIGNHKVVINDIACRPCYRRFRRASCDHVSCLNGISVDDVFKKVEEML